MAKRYYLAYGSNLNIRQMQFRCPTARPIGTAMLQGYELVFRGSKTGSCLTIEPKDGSSVPVAVWDVTKDDERRLDSYEGCPRFYYKQDMKIPVKSLENGKTRIRNVFAYIMPMDRPKGRPTVSYVAACMEGYRDFDFDPSILEKAYAQSRGEV